MKMKEIGPRAKKHTTLTQYCYLTLASPLILDPPLITEFRIDLSAYRTERHQTVREEFPD